MKKRMILFIALIFSSQCYLQNFEWAKSFGNNDFNFVNSLTVDSDGNVYTIGFLRGTVDFDPNEGVYNLTTNGSFDVYIQKLDKDGNLLWAQLLGESGGDVGNDITIDNKNNVISTGSFYNTVDFDSSSNTYELSSGGDSDIYIQKLDKDGNFLWAKSFESSSSNNISSVTTDTQNNIYVTGSFTGEIKFSKDDSNFSAISNEEYGRFIVKMDENGNVKWFKTIDSKSSNIGIQSTIDKNNNIYIRGRFKGTVDFNPSKNEIFNLTSEGEEEDVYILKLDVNGNFIWAKSFGNEFLIGSTSIDLDYSDNIILTGGFQGEISFSSSIDNFKLTSNGNLDIFILKMNSDGDYLWGKSFGGSGSDYANDIAIDSENNIYSVGQFENTINFNSTKINSVGEIDAYMLKLNSDGNFLWNINYGSSAGETLVSISIDDANNIYSTGKYGNTVDFDPSDNIYNLTAQDFGDIFTLKFSQHTLSTNDLKDIQSNIIIYPNPSSDWVFFNTEEKVKNIFLNTMDGKQVKYHLESEKLKISDLASGIYVLSYEINNVKYFRKILKK